MVIEEVGKGRVDEVKGDMDAYLRRFERVIESIHYSEEPSYIFCRKVEP